MKAAAVEGEALAPVARWMPIAAALCYPFLLKWFHLQSGAPSVAHRALAALLLLGAIVLPFGTGLHQLIVAGKARHFGSEQATAATLGLLAVAAAPVYTTLGVLMYMAGEPVSELAIWLVFWPLLALVATRITRTAHAGHDRPPRAYARVAHGLAALAVVLVFLAMHLFNHLAGVVSDDLHRQLMDAFRRVYRASLLEPVVVALFLFQVGSGMLLLARRAARPQDALGALQLVTGTYLVFFCLGHMNSVFLYARLYAGIETDWAFATGAPVGLIRDPWNVRLIPHYFLGVFSVLAHLAIGARGVARAHGVSLRTADRACWAGVAAAAVIGCVILLGMGGIRLVIEGVRV